MKYLIIFLFISFGIILFGAGCTPTSPVLPLNQTAMRLSSSAFQNNEMIPSRYSCDGDDVSPPLEIEDIPENARSLALIVDDPDAPRGDWVHWAVWNISPDTTSIAEDSVPIGAIEGTTDFGRNEWGGPCPPSGVHRYQFKLYALDTLLSLPSSAKKQDVEQAMQGHILAQTMLIGRYQRQ